MLRGKISRNQSFLHSGEEVEIGGGDRGPTSFRTEQNFSYQGERKKEAPKIINLDGMAAGVKKLR